MADALNQMNFESLNFLMHTQMQTINAHEILAYAKHAKISIDYPIQITWNSDAVDLVHYYHHAQNFANLLVT